MQFRYISVWYPRKPGSLIILVSILPLNIGVPSPGLPRLPGVSPQRLP
jgi:hypothetical protein